MDQFEALVLMLVSTWGVLFGLLMGRICMEGVLGLLDSMIPGREVP